MKKILYVIVILFSIINISYALNDTVEPSNVGGTATLGVICTQDVKLCPDGVNYVSRTGPNCEFAQCPNSPNLLKNTKLKLNSTIKKIINISKKQKNKTEFKEKIINKLNEITSSNQNFSSSAEYIIDELNKYIK